MLPLPLWESRSTGPVWLSLLKVCPHALILLNLGSALLSFQENLCHIDLFLVIQLQSSLDCPFSPSLETMTSAKTQKGKVGYCGCLCDCFLRPLSLVITTSENFR